MPFTIEDLQAQQNTNQEQKPKDNEEQGFFHNALAGLFTGIYNIPKGFISLGKELYDITNNTNTAKEFEDWWDKTNPFFDDYQKAKETTTGKIAELIGQLAIPETAIGYLGAKGGALVAEKLASTALKARQEGKILNLSNIGEKIIGAKSGGIVGAGIGSALVSDQEIGTFADMLRGTSLEPYAITMMDIEDKEGRQEAYRKLLNRVKFGTENALFNTAMVGLGKGIQALRRGPESLETGAYSENLPTRYMQIAQDWLSSVGAAGAENFGFKRTNIRNVQAAEFEAKAINTKLQDSVKTISKNIYQDLGVENPQLAQDKIFNIIKNALTDKENPLLDKDNLKNIFGNIEQLKESGKIEKITADSFKQTLLNNPNISLDEIFKYDVNKNPELKNLFEIIQKNHGDTKLLENTIINMRSSVDKLSFDALRRGLPDNEFRAIYDNLGSYFTTDYKNYALKNWYEKLKPTSEEFETAVQQWKNSEWKSGSITAEDLDKKARQAIQDYINNPTKDEANFAVQPKTIIGSGKQVSSVGFDKSLLMQKKDLKDWQLTLLGKEIDNPVFNFYSTISKLSKFNSAVGFLDSVGKSAKKIGRIGVEDEVTGGVNHLFYENINEDQKQRAENILANYQIEQTKNKLDESGIKMGEEEQRQIKNQSKKIVNNYVNENTKDDKSILELLNKSKNPEQLINEPWQKELILKPTTADEYFKKNLIFSKEDLGVLGKENAINDSLQFKKIEPLRGFKDLSLTDLEGQYIKTRAYDPIFQTTSNWLNTSLSGQLYKYSILAPKGLSQAAKTVLSLTTHGRNFVTASAYVAANGGLLDFNAINKVLPKSLGGEGLLGKAYDLTGKRLLGTMSEEDKELYKRLIKVDVVNSQLEVGQTKEILNDALHVPNDANVFNKLMNNRKLQKLYGFAQDSYTAEDDYWKIVNWHLERDRFDKILNQNGINENNYFNKLTKDLSGYTDDYLKTLPLSEKQQIEQEIKLQKFFIHDGLNKDMVRSSYRDFLDEFAGHLTRNQIPNYNYISAAGKALRFTPFGNFIAFPLEIMRTGNNIATQAIKEFTSGIEGLSGLNGLGAKRLASFVITAAGIPTALVAAGKAYSNASNDEMVALRRFVPSYSKDSVLVPFGRDEKGYLKYINLSYANPYDLLIKPFSTLFAKVGEGIEDNESLYKSLGDSMMASAKEILKPFTSESIYTEALVDSIFGNGIGKDGKRIWSPDDDSFVKIEKSLFHIGESLLPTTFTTGKRFNEAIFGKTDDYGNTFKLTDELPGLMGARILQVNPEEAMKFKTNTFGSKIEQDKSLFTSPLLKGGRVTPNDVINSYKYSEARRYNNMREMYLDIRAAQKLGVPTSVIEKSFEKKPGITADIKKNIMNGNYIPNVPNKIFADKLQEITDNLNNKEGVYLPNPLIDSLPTINQIINTNKNKNLLTDPLEMPPAPLITSQYNLSNLLPEAFVPDSGNVISSGNNYQQRQKTLDTLDYIDKIDKI